MEDSAGRNLASEFQVRVVAVAGSEDNILSTQQDSEESSDLEFTAFNTHAEDSLPAKRLKMEDGWRYAEKTDCTFSSETEHKPLGHNIELSACPISVDSGKKTVSSICPSSIDSQENNTPSNCPVSIDSDDDLPEIISVTVRKPIYKMEKEKEDYPLVTRLLHTLSDPSKATSNDKLARVASELSVISPSLNITEIPEGNKCDTECNNDTQSDVQVFCSTEKVKTQHSWLDSSDSEEDRDEVHATPADAEEEKAQDDLPDLSKVKCPICDKVCRKTELGNHIDYCLGVQHLVASSCSSDAVCASTSSDSGANRGVSFEDLTEPEIEITIGTSATSLSPEYKKCPFCGEFWPESLINDHANRCVSGEEDSVVSVSSTLSTTFNPITYTGGSAATTSSTSPFLTTRSAENPVKLLNNSSIPSQPSCTQTVAVDDEDDLIMEPMPALPPLSPTRSPRLAEDRGVPCHWGPMLDGHDYSLHPLLVGSQEYQDVVNRFLETLQQDVTIETVDRVQNVFLYSGYMLHRRKIEKQNPGREFEKKLWHGTANTSINGINTNGFNRSFCGQNGVAYGQGVYFATTSGYSSRFAQPDQLGRSKMFLAKVLVGEYTKGRPDMKVPPLKGDRNNPDLHYDSTVDNPREPTMYVVYHDTQAYPEYLVTYRLNVNQNHCSALHSVQLMSGLLNTVSQVGNNSKYRKRKRKR